LSIPFEIIVLDKPRKIKFGYKGLLTAQVLTGKKVLEMINDAAMIDVDVLSKLLYAGLQHEDNELTVDKVIELVDEYADDLTKVMDATTDALCAAIGVKKEKPADDSEDDPNGESPVAITEQSPGTLGEK